MSRINHDVIQYAGTALALVISVAALIVSIYEANLLKDQQRATVWPHVSIVAYYNSEGFGYRAINSGIGPAIVRSMEVRYAGELVENMDTLLDRLEPGRKIGYDRLRMNRLNNTVIMAGEERVLLQMPWDEETRRMVKNIETKGVTTRMTYCSVLDDCWVYDSESETHQAGTFKSELEFGK